MTDIRGQVAEALNEFREIDACLADISTAVRGTRSLLEGALAILNTSDGSASASHDDTDMTPEDFERARAESEPVQVFTSREEYEAHQESAAEWSATGLENQGRVTPRGSIPPLSAQGRADGTVTSRVANPKAATSGAGSTPAPSAEPERGVLGVRPSLSTEERKDIGVVIAADDIGQVKYQSATSKSQVGSSVSGQETDIARVDYQCKATRTFVHGEVLPCFFVRGHAGLHSFEPQARFFEAAEVSGPETDMGAGMLADTLDKLTQARTDIGFLLDTVIWMSGSEDFNPNGGKAGAEWERRRERVYGILGRHNGSVPDASAARGMVVNTAMGRSGERGVSDVPPDVDA